MYVCAWSIIGSDIEKKKKHIFRFFNLLFLCYEKMCLSIYVYIPDIFLKTVPSASPCVHIDSQIVVFKRVYTEWSVFIKLSISYCQIPFFFVFFLFVFHFKLFSDSHLVSIWYPCLFLILFFIRIHSKSCQKIVRRRGFDTWPEHYNVHF